MDAPSPAILPQGAPRPVPELTLVVPAFIARDAVAPLVEKLAGALAGVEWEIIFVDDNSTDDTVAAIAAMGEADPRVRVIRRVGRSGLTQTCLVAMLASGARYVAML